MIYLDNDTINLTRGDDAAITFALKNSDGTTYTLGESEYLIFGVKESPDDNAETLLEIESAAGSNVISFLHEDTADLPVGFYSAECQKMSSAGLRTTVWPKLEGSKRTSTANRRNFCLMSEVIRT